MRSYLLPLALLAAPLLAPAGSLLADPADMCARLANDDTVRPYEPSLRQGFSRAFRTLFPDARGAVTDTMLRDQGSYRCMDGRLLACFTGANLPCSKIDVERKNAAVDRYCATAGTTDFVPLYVVGHDSAYGYRCLDGRAAIDGETWTLDKRGFAAKLWAPMD